MESTGQDPRKDQNPEFQVIRMDFNNNVIGQPQG